MDEPKDYPYTYEAEQNAKGYFQLRVKIKSDKPLTSQTIDDEVSRVLKTLKKAIESEGYHVQGEEEKKVKIKLEKETKADDFHDHGENGPGKI